MNPQLEGLHEIVLPETVSWLPQTPVWFALLALLAVLAGWSIYKFHGRRRANLYRQVALRELNRMTTTPDEIPELVKRVALKVAPRKEVASLTGSAWLQFLDRSYGGTGFSEGPGRILPTLAYGSNLEVSKVSEGDINQLKGLVRQWIQEHKRSLITDD